MSIQQPICVDGFGTEVYACRYTGIPVWADVAVRIGAVMPGVRAVYFMSPMPDAAIAKKASDQAFHENEANCNTCISLERAKHSKNKAGFLYGKCLNPNKAKSLYPETNGVMQFHPDDPMNMPCYQPRWINLLLKQE